LRLKIVFVNRFYFPDHSATSQMLTELASELVVAGRNVHVITSRLLYEQSKADLIPREVVRGVVVHRVWSTRFGRRNLIGRAIDYSSFYWSAFFQLLLVLRRGDLVVAKTDPPLISVVAAFAASLRQARLINWLQDIFPEVAIHLGIDSMRGPLGTIAKRLRNYSLRRAAVNVVLGERMAGFVQQYAPCPVIIHNWGVGAPANPIPARGNELRQQWQIGDRFVVGYSGNLGRAHEYQIIVDAVDTLQGDDQLLFLFIGGGKGLDELRTELIRRGLSQRVMFRPYQPVERLALSLAVADVHLVTLRPSLEGLIVPSKFYGIAAAGRPTLFLGDLDGEIPRILHMFDCGVSVETSDVSGLVSAIQALRTDPRRVARLGRNARLAYEQYFDRRLAIGKWSAVIEKARNPM
jgi:colanic acid biosynthesis glycosyl transferase WcaI